MTHITNYPIHFSAIASTVGMPNNSFTYEWSFGDGGTASTQNLDHNYTSPSTYFVSVTATDTTTFATATANRFITVISAPTPTNNNWRGISGSRDGSIIYAGRDTGNIYKSAGYGAGLVAVKSDTLPWLNMASNSNGSIVIGSAYSSASSPGGLYISSDSGVTWSAVDPTSIYFQCAASISGQYLYSVTRSGTFGAMGLHRSTDYGVTWTQVSSISSSTAEYPGVCCSSDGHIVYCGGSTSASNVFKSTDYGATFTPLPSAPQNYCLGMACSDDGSVIYMLESIGDTHVWVSLDGGSTWAFNSSPQSTTWHGISCSANGSLVVVGGTSGASNAAYISKDYGSTYSNLNFPAGGQYWSCWVSRDSGWIYVANDGGYIYSSNDYGVTWYSL